MTDEEKSPTVQGGAEKKYTDQIDISGTPATQGEHQKLGANGGDKELVRLLDALVAAFTKHLSLPTGAVEALALWVVLSHVLESTDIAPRLLLISPLPECGKAATLGILAQLVSNPAPASNVTPAIIFRTLEFEKQNGNPTPTFLIDEGDTFMDQRGELIGIINSGFTRSGAIARRCGDNKQGHKPLIFTTFGLIAIARILQMGSIPKTLQSRSIMVWMQRAKPGEKIARITSIDRDSMKKLAGQLAAWGAANVKALVDADPKMPEGFRYRLADKWRQLFAIADLAGPVWSKRARDAARSTEGELESSIYEQLLAGIKKVFEVTGASKISSAELAANPVLQEFTGTTWSQTSLANALKTFNIKSKSIRTDPDHTPKGYERSQFVDIWERYLG